MTCVTVRPAGFISKVTHLIRCKNMILAQISPEENNLAGSTVLVTGAAGFIGSHLSQRLLRIGCKVKAMVRYSSNGRIGFLDEVESRDLSQLEILHGDIRDVSFAKPSAGATMCST